MRCWTPILALVLIECCSARSFAQDAGDAVVALRDMPVTIGSRIASFVSRGELVRVRERQGDWLWVAQEATLGWIPRSNFAAPEQAAAWLSECIQQNPRDARA